MCASLNLWGRRNPPLPMNLERLVARTVTAAHPSAIVVLAAGEGTRMRSSTPKVLHSLCGRSLLGHVMHAAASLEPQHIVVVVGHARERVAAHIADDIVPCLPKDMRDRVRTVVQHEQRGTGHAMRCALEALPELSGTVLAANGDVPLLRPQTLAGLVQRQRSGSYAATVLTASVLDPRGLGRIIRDDQGNLLAIVEERDATETQRALTEINSGVFAFEAAALREMLSKLTTNNDQGQEYLTDVVRLLREAGASVAAHIVDDYRETLGANDRLELAQLGALLRDRLAEHWMRSGATIVDPSSVWLDVTVELSRDVTIEPGVQLRGTTAVGENAIIGPDSTLVNTQVGPGARVMRSHCEGAEIGAGASVGPFAFLRPAARLAQQSKVGAFVEVKNSHVGVGSKVPHLSYVGDADIGEHTNIGAATVFVNYDGVNKYRSRIGSYCRTGSDNMFVAPVTVGDGAYTGAGSVVTMDVPPGALALARAEQINIEGWVQRRRPGTTSAEAANRALSSDPDQDHPDHTTDHPHEHGDAAG